MQAWSTVKVTDPKSEYVGRAGLVQSFDESTGINQVKLDETETHEEGVVELKDDQVVLLGQ